MFVVIAIDNLYFEKLTPRRNIFIRYIVVYHILIRIRYFSKYMHIDLAPIDIEIVTICLLKSPFFLLFKCPSSVELHLTVIVDITIRYSFITAE